MVSTLCVKFQKSAWPASLYFYLVVILVLWGDGYLANDRGVVSIHAKLYRYKVPNYKVPNRRVPNHKVLITKFQI